jgi:beta-lactamase class A
MTASGLQKEKEETEERTQETTEELLPEEKEESGDQPEITNEAEEAGKSENPDQADAREEEIPSRVEDLADLMKTLSERISSVGGEWSVYVKYLPTGEGIGIDSRTMVAASLIKLYVAGAYLEAVEQGDVQDLYDESLRNMLSHSDNDAANRLIGLLGMDRINDFINKHGFEDSQLNRLMLANNGLENYTSVKDCTNLLEEVYNGSFVSQEASERILSALKEQTVRTKIPAGLPEDVICANKTGELANIENDSAIVFSQGGDYIFCVMSGRVSAGNAQKEIQAMSRIIYEKLGKTE